MIADGAHSERNNSEATYNRAHTKQRKQGKAACSNSTYSQAAAAATRPSSKTTRPGHGVLVDCGICKRDFLARCNKAHLRPREHRRRAHYARPRRPHQGPRRGHAGTRQDEQRQPLVYAADETVRASKAVQDATSSCETRSFRPEECLTAAGISIFPFATSHDAAASFGFRFEADGDAAGFMTDTGIVTPQAHAHLADVRLLALESNHDPNAERRTLPLRSQAAYRFRQRTSFERTGRRRARIPSQQPPSSRGDHARVGEQQRIRPRSSSLSRRDGARRVRRPCDMRLPRTPLDACLTYEELRPPRYPVLS